MIAVREWTFPRPHGDISLVGVRPHLQMMLGFNRSGQRGSRGASRGEGRLGLRGARAGFREAVVDILDLVTEQTGAKEGAIGPANQVAHAVRMGQSEGRGQLRGKRRNFVPGRLQIVLYVDNERQRIKGFGYHVWHEVNVNQRWVALDSSWEQSNVDATHIKLGDTSLDGVASFRSLPPHRSRSRKAGDRPRRTAVTRTEGREAARGGTRMIDPRRSISTHVSMPRVASGPRHAPRDSVLYLGGSIRRLQRRWQVS